MHADAHFAHATVNAVVASLSAAATAIVLSDLPAHSHQHQPFVRTPACVRMMAHDEVADDRESKKDCKN